MDFKREDATLSQITADCLIVGTCQGDVLAKLVSSLDKSFPQSLANHLDAAAASEKFEGKAGQTLTLPTFGQLPATRLIFWGMGKAADCHPNATRKLAANAARRLKAQGHGDVCYYFTRADDELDHVQAFVEGFILGTYSFAKYKSTDKERSKIGSVSLAGLKTGQKNFAVAVKTGTVIAESTNFARDLIAEPAAYMTPTQLAQEARRVSKQLGLNCEVMERAQMEKLGMGALLGVARGASEPPRFIVMRYAYPKSKKTVAIVGKGITFDSGGLSLKPAQSMEHMKYDMSGAAAVLAVMQAVGRLQPKVSVIGVVAASENMPGGKALHPGDVLVAMNGKTIEVNNTDAEGRLVLADALSYVLTLKPAQIIDIATLTGGVVTALGRAAAGVMGNNQKLVDALIASAAQAGEKLWQLPLFDEYKDYLKSDIADLKNAGSRGEAASSAGAMFLREFVDGTEWAHLDIAGPGWMDKDKDELNKGGTAFGVRTLCRYLLSR